MKLNDVNFELLNAACKIHHADWNWKNVNSPFARLYMVESGTARIVMPDGVRVIRPGFLYLVPSFTTHGYESDSTFVLYYFHIYSEFSFFDLHYFPFEIESDDLDAMLVKRLLAVNPNMELQRSDPSTYDKTPLLAKTLSERTAGLTAETMETKGILMLLLSKFLSLAQPKNNTSEIRVIKALQYIHEHVNEDLTVARIAKLCKLNSDYFARIFKRETSFAPLEYINKRKMEKAQLMLAVNRKPIKVIASELSFSDTKHFNKLFNKMVGMSPKQYKKMHYTNAICGLPVFSAAIDDDSP